MILRAMAHPGKGVLPDRESPGEPSIISSRHAARAALLPHITLPNKAFQWLHVCLVFRSEASGEALN